MHQSEPGHIGDTLTVCRIGAQTQDVSFVD
jgi:hypothetical protein